LNTVKSGADKKNVEQMFNDISERYDLLNHLLSFGIDRLWRRALIRKLKRHYPKTILDVATGTGDLAINAARNTGAQITGTDIATKMLEIAGRKIGRAGLSGQIQLCQANGEILPFPDKTFDALTISFGIRNFENPEKGLQEFLRVLKPGGNAFILEFSMPSSVLVRLVYRLYFGRILPFIGRQISKHTDAYSYLPGSVELFPYGEAFAAMMRKAGFSGVEVKKLSGGIATLYSGKVDS
jgi:demethylmenaquinone methyltransferase / 2-methoxy-6-polyprenyl-1,4-benzoquinol methylase